MSETLAAIDRLITEQLMSRVCRRKTRGRCECGHTVLVHENYRVGPTAGHCRGGHRRDCPCERFVPYDYFQEDETRREKYRAFAFAILRELGGRS